MNSDLLTLPRMCFDSSLNMKPVFILLTILLVSCGGGGSGGSSEVTSSDLTNSPIVGRWISPCDASNGSSSFASTVEFFTDGTFLLTASGYFDLACSVAGFDGTTTGTVQESIAFELPDRGVVRNIDLITNTYSLIPRSDESVFFFNTESTCGISNWEVGVDFDISDCTNRPGDNTSRRPTPFADFSIYLVERGLLFYGNELSFTADNRPNTIATRPSLIRPTGAIGDEFPQNLQGFWVLPESNQFLELAEQGLIKFYWQTDQGCFNFSFLTLFSEGGDQYLDPFGIFPYTISELDGNLQLRFGTDSQASVYMPSSIPVDQLTLCS